MSRAGRSAVRHRAVIRAVMVAMSGVTLTGCSLLQGGTASLSAETVAPSTSPPSGPTVPAAAKKTSNDGAQAFVSHWFNTLNSANTSLESAQLTPISDGTCVFCNRSKQKIDSLKAESRRIEGGRTTISNFKLVRGDTSGTRLDCVYDQATSSLLDGTGTKISTVKAKKSGKMAVAVKWTGTQWTMLEVVIFS